MYVIARRPAADAAPSGDSLRSQSVLPPWLPLWGSCHEVTERVNIALSAFGTSPIGRGKAHIACRLSRLYSPPCTFLKIDYNNNTMSSFCKILVRRV